MNPNTQSITIRPATVADAQAIGRAVVEAIGHDHAAHMIGLREGGVEAAVRLFADLAAMEGPQYSFANTLVAETPEGESAGVVVSYDGGRLHAMRPYFVELMASRHGRRFSQMADETFAGEYYIDTLAVEPAFRGHGIGRALLMRAVARGHAAGLLPTLLVAKGNAGARRLYMSCGFGAAGERDFAGEMMDVMVHRGL